MITPIGSITDVQNVQGQPYPLQMNDVFLLSDPQKVWMIRTGSVSVFAVTIREGMPQGLRRYLFSAKAGDALFGSVPTTGRKSRTLMAVAVEPTELVQLAPPALIQLVTDSDPRAIYCIEEWIRQLGSLITQIPVAALQVKSLGGSESYTLDPQQNFQIRGAEVAWVNLQQGKVNWSGIRDLSLTPEAAWLPLAGNMWLQAAESSILLLEPTEDLASADLLAGMNLLHSYCLRFIEQLDQQEEREAYGRFRERKRLNLELMETALDSLVGLLQPADQVIAAEGTPLLTAARAVGQAMGVSFSPPAGSEDLSKVKEPLEAIARASRLRWRRVLLRDRWWQQEAGPLLTYTREDKQPVALLPKAGNQYVVFDPIQRTYQPVTAAVAETISPEAYTFYRSLPLTTLKVLDLLTFALAKRYSTIVTILVCVLAGTVLGMVAPQATAILIDQAIPDANRGLLLQLGLGLLASTFGSTIFKLTQGFATLRLETQAESDMSSAVWDRLLNVEVPFFRNYSTGDLQARAGAINEIRRRLTGSTLQTLLSSLFALINLGLMLYYSVPLALVAVGVAVVSTLGTTAMGLLLIRGIRRLQEIGGELNGLIVELIGGISKLRVAGAESRAFAHWGKQYTEQQRLTLNQQLLEDRLTVFNQVLPLVSSVLLFGVASLSIQSAQAQGGSGLSIGTFLAFSSAFGTFVSGATSLSNLAFTVLEVVSLWDRAKPILAAKLEVDLSKADPGRLVGKVALDHINFCYVAGSKLILSDVSIEANPGEFIALVGPSGSGKSTLFRLLLGFEQPASGKIFFDGQDLAGLNLQAVRRQLGVVMQNGQLNSGSVFENITAGALLSMDEAWEAARHAGFADDIQSMPMGMHTVVSEGGSNLSGGQRQRLLIARALALKPRVLLFDEATSALDNRTQAIVSESLDKLRVTRIVIAHRLSTIRNADRIYVLQAGQVVEQGSFDQLAALNATFSKLMASQKL